MPNSFLEIVGHDPRGHQGNAHIPLKTRRACLQLNPPSDELFEWILKAPMIRFAMRYSLYRAFLGRIQAPAEHTEEVLTNQSEPNGQRYGLGLLHAQRELRHNQRERRDKR